MSDQCEVIIVDDASDGNHDISKIGEMYPGMDIKVFSFTPEEKWWSCPVIPANLGIAKASGDIVVLQGAEIYHGGDILKDISERIKPNKYLVYAVLALSEIDTINVERRLNFKYSTWYQHSIHRNVCYNFCTAIFREDLMRLGGFDERYGHGIWYGDNDFILRIRRMGMDVITIDSPYAYHQYHPTMQVNPKTDQMCDKELYEHVLNNETGYHVKNSFLKNDEPKA